MAQRGSKDIVKIVHVTSVVQPLFYKAIEILFVCKEIQIIIFLQQILLMLHGLFYVFNYVSVPGNISVTLLSMQSQKALGFHQKYLYLCSKKEQRSYGFGKI